MTAVRPPFALEPGTFAPPIEASTLIQGHGLPVAKLAAGAGNGTGYLAHVFFGRQPLLRLDGVASGLQIRLHPGNVPAHDIRRQAIVALRRFLHRNRRVTQIFPRLIPQRIFLRHRFQGGTTTGAEPIVFAVPAPALRTEYPYPLSDSAANPSLYASIFAGRPRCDARRRLSQTRMVP